MATINDRSIQNVDWEFDPQADTCPVACGKEVIKIYSNIEKHIQQEDISADVQHELVRLLGITKRCSELSDFCGCIKDLHLAACSLTKTKPDIILAQGIMCNIEVQMMKRMRPYSWLVFASKASPFAVVNIGLFSSLLIALALFVVVSGLSSVLDVSEMLGRSWPNLIYTLSAAFVGSMASITLRTGSYAKLRNIDLVLLFWTALSKPFLGVVFSVVIFCMFNAAMIPADMKPDSMVYFWVVVGFLSGFSERFASDLISRAEAAVLVSPNAKSGAIAR
jgi:hypothetical protein